MYYLYILFYAVYDDEEEEANSHHVNKLKKGRHEPVDLKIEEDLSKEELAEKFELLKIAFEDLKGVIHQYLES